MATKIINSPEVITCKAAVCWGANEPMKVEEIEVEPPKSHEVRIKVLCASICHTDLIFYDGFPFPLFPRVLGHEGVGIVESTGDEVKDLKEGDTVMPLYIGECKECENCKSEKSNMCLKYPMSTSGLMLDGTSRMSIRGKKLYHSFSCSTWSEYTVIDAGYVIKINRSLDLAHASLLSCGFTTGFGSTWKHIETGSIVAVIGLGAVGLGAVEGARIKGASRIFGIDINEMKKAKGEAFGMTDFINPKASEKSISELVKHMTHGMGVDYCIECTGVSTLIDQALLSTKLGKGTAIIVGAGKDFNVQISFLPLITGGSVKGCCFGGLKPKTDLPLVLDKCHNKEFHLDELVTHEVKLEDINKALKLMKQEDSVKVLVRII